MAALRVGDCREPVEEEFGRRVDNLVEVSSGAGVMEPVFGAFVLKQCTVIACLEHRVPEPSRLPDRRNLIMRPVLNQHWRISSSHELNRRVLDRPSGSNASVLFKELLLLWRVGEQIDHRVQGHDAREAGSGAGMGLSGAIIAATSAR